MAALEQATGGGVVSAEQSDQVIRCDRIETADGLKLATYECGNPAGPEILFIHGLAQSYLSFSRQFASALAATHRLVAYDLRGHGDSEKPSEPRYYREGRRWADEVAAVIEAKALRRPVLVGWSLGGRVLRQYLVHYGDAHLAGIHIVSSRPIEDPRILAAASRADLASRPKRLSERIGANIAFLRACFAIQPSEDEFAVALAYNMMVPGEVREAIGGWATDIRQAREALEAVSVPTIISHGLRDSLILPAAAEMTASAIKHSRISWYDECGHSPFFEDAPRFNRELAEFVASIEELTTYGQRA
jgi:pimeloyl-ACP methyl ester carboxylesterase